MYSILTSNPTTSLSFLLIPATCDIMTHCLNDTPDHTHPPYDTQPHRQFIFDLYH